MNSLRVIGLGFKGECLMSRATRHLSLFIEKAVFEHRDDEIIYALRRGRLALDELKRHIVEHITSQGDKVAHREIGTIAVRAE